MSMIHSHERVATLKSFVSDAEKRSGAAMPLLFYARALWRWWKRVRPYP